MLTIFLPLYFADVPGYPDSPGSIAEIRCRCLESANFRELFNPPSKANTALSGDKALLHSREAEMSGQALAGMVGLLPLHPATDLMEAHHTESHESEGGTGVGNRTG